VHFIFKTRLNTMKH